MADVYAYEVTGNPSELFGVIDLTTGAFTSVGSTGHWLAGIGNFGGVIYGSDYHGNTLYSVNTSTGALTTIGTSNISYFLFGSTTSGLYAVGDNGDLYSINPANGAATDIGPTGVDQHATVMGMSAGSDTLYITKDNLLYSLNTTSGAASLVGTLNEGEIVMAWASGKISTTEVLRNWLIVYCGNLVGSLGLVILVLLSHHSDFNGGRIGLSILNTAAAKISPDMVTLFFKGILCNVLVCLGVWLAYAGRSVTDKIVGLILPISAFVAAGFEHCIANMYFLPLAWLLTETGKVPTDFDASVITIPGIIHNLVPVTLGNIVGGAGLVGFVYWSIYRKVEG